MVKLGGNRTYSWDDSISDISEISKEKKEFKTKKVAKKIPTSFSIDENLVQKLNNFCYWERKNKSQIVEELVQNFLKKNGTDENLKEIMK